MRKSIAALVLLRSIFFCFILFLLDTSIDLGTPLPATWIAACAGTILGSRLSFTRLTHRGFLAAGLFLFIFYKLFVYAVSLIKVSRPGYYFISTVIDSHLSLFLLVFAATAVSTWLFWKVRFTLTAEVLALLAASISLLSGHRNFHFESPRILNDIAWELSMQPLSVLVLLGVLIIFFISLYVYLASITNRLHFAKRGVLTRGRRNLLINTATAAIVFAVIYGVSSAIFNHYDREALSRTANGVGQDKGEGMSPLDFHSALGSTNQPSALVRLEGDYKENPFLPMLYLRESALSEFNGKEMVTTSTFDQDVNGTSPDQVFEVDENEHLKDRRPLVQSIYLLSNHKLAFAVDYPVEIKQIKNPNTKRFKASYLAKSLVPAYKLEALKDKPLGEEDWSPETWSHYLKTHPDKRYADLAMEITNSYSTSSAPTPEKAFMITNYLSKNAIYTLTPNHEVKPGEDPVVPFLFGDLRGYCVHFAHATVYMLRALGIPARIATGYLTDLSQAKDGHILLRMSDRHAWAEVYVRSVGWVPFDTQPEKVESHAETQVDMKLLEELMGMLEPGQEILPDSTLDNEDNVYQEPPAWLPEVKDLYVLLTALVLSLLFIKAYLRYGYLIKITPSARAKAAYLSVASILYDLGFRRLPGETRSEFKERMMKTLNLSSFSLTEAVNNLQYAPAYELSLAAVKDRASKDLSSFKTLPVKRRLLCAVNPSSVFAFIARHRW